MRFLLIGLLVLGGCAQPKVQEDTEKVRSDFNDRMERNLERDRMYCRSLGGTVVLGKSFDQFYVSHCIIGPNPVVIAR